MLQPSARSLPVSLLALVIVAVTAPDAGADKATREQLRDPVDVEGFEGVISPQPDAGVQVAPAGLTFGSGLWFYGPPPQPGASLFTVADFSVAPPDNPIVYDPGTNGLIDGPEDIHGGTAFSASTLPRTEFFVFVLPQPTRALGLYVSAFNGAGVTLSAFDEFGEEAARESFASTAPAPLDADNFVGLSSEVDLYAFGVAANGNFAMDDVVFEVPEPTSSLLARGAIVALALCRRRRPGPVVG